MERTAISAVAAGDALRRPAGSLRGLWRRLEPVTLARLLAARWTEGAAYAAAVSACLLFSQHALDRHRGFESNAYDFGFFDQIIWNTSHGRWFATSFTPYNFLGQHFQPVLLLFALAYRLGAGIELLLITQTIFAAAAALPLFYAVRKATSSGLVALPMCLGFLLSASLHDALDFDFHPELMGFFFVFLALYYLVARRPVATITSLLPLLLLKEDMPLVLGAFAVLLFARGFRREGRALFLIAGVWAVAIVLVVMPVIRGGSGDLTQRYGYLFADATWWSIVPEAVSRAVSQLWTEPLAAVLRLAGSTGFIGVLSPLAVFVAAPAFLLAALSDHTRQSQLELHYAMTPLALAWVAGVLGLQRLARDEQPDRAVRPRHRSLITATAATFVLSSSIVTFLLWSPYSPRVEGSSPGATHRGVLRDALALIPAGVPVSAQNTILPHVSRREHVFEFPYLQDAQYVIVDPSLPVTDQSRGDGYDRVIAELPHRGFAQIFDREGVQVFRRAP